MCRIRITNVIERTFRELRKRTKSIYFFTNEDSCQRTEKMKYKLITIKNSYRLQVLVNIL